MDVHPPKNGMYRYWSIAISSYPHYILNPYQVVSIKPLVSSLVWSHVFWLYQVISSLHPQSSNQQPLFPHSQNGILVLNKYLKKSSNHSSNGFSGHNRSISWQPGQFDDFLSPQNVPEKHQKWSFPATNPWNLPSFPMGSMPLAALLAPPRSPAKSWENHGKITGKTTIHGGF